MILATGDIGIWVFWLVLCVVNTLLAGMFAGAETGMYLISRVRVELRAEAGSKRARILQRFLNHMDNTLAMLLIGTNIHQYVAAFAVSAMFVLSGHEHNAEWYTLAVTTPLLFVFKDSVPKSLFQRIPRKLVYLLAWPLRGADVFYKLVGMTYLVRLFSSGLLRLLGRKRTDHSLLGHEGLAKVVDEGHASGALTHTQREMADRVMRISHVQVSTAMQPMKNVSAVPADISREGFLDEVRKHNYSRLPVLASDGQVVGVVDVYNVLGDEKQMPIAQWMLPPLVVPTTVNVTQAMYTMQRARRRLAVVIDHQGQHVGILTMKDLVEEIVGELGAW